MNQYIEIYRDKDPKIFATIQFMPIVIDYMEKMLGKLQNNIKIYIQFLAVPEETQPISLPLVSNIIPEYGYCYIKVFQGNQIIYQHPHPLSEVITARLQEILREKYPEDSMWGFRLNVPGMPKVSSYRAAPKIEGSTIIQPVQNFQPLFTIKKMEEKVPDNRTLSDFGIKPQDVETQAKVKVILKEKVNYDLLKNRAFSSDFEEGGFLIGQVYLETNTADNYIVEISDAVAASHTGASFLHFTFTGNSFAEVKRSLRQERPGERLLGWYHTHLFQATDALGLSTIDFTLHFGTFVTFPWQLAGLINIDNAHRTLRFYRRNEKTMTLCPYWVINQ